LETYKKVSTDCPEILKEYDFILLDLPPAMNDEVKGIIAHCDTMFVPVMLGAFELAGLADVT
jgi:cellulose biosynthesis protein BcsQ